MSDAADTVAVIGAGLIGRSWALAFARGGLSVRLADARDGAAAAAAEWAADEAGRLAPMGLLRGQDAGAVAARIRPAEDVTEAVEGAALVQECIAETAEAKRALVAAVEAAAHDDAVIASSTSALMPSVIFARARRPERGLVAHPLNPPHLVPAVEIVPGPATAAAAVERARALMAGIGQSPVVLAAETPGFAMNRLQGALLDEAFALVAEGLLTPGDVDRAMCDGLARRWCFMGPFETIDPNAPGGVTGFVERYGAAYDVIGRGRPNRHPWTEALVGRIARDRRAALPEDRLPARQAWRDRRLAALSSHLTAEAAE